MAEWATGVASITIDEISDAIREVDPRARFVSTRVLRRIVRQERGLSVFAMWQSHPESLIVKSSAALRSVDATDLNLDPLAPVPETLLLLESPNPQDMEGSHPLLVGWMHLFHARVHEELRRLRDSGQLIDEVLTSRIAALGPIAFAEIRSVLHSDHRLLTPNDDFSVYEEFVAVSLKLRYFFPTLRAATFPAIRTFKMVDEMIDNDVNSSHLFTETRPNEAPDPLDSPVCTSSTKEELVTTHHERNDWRANSRFTLLNRRADRVVRLGNVVGGAILRHQSSTLVGRSRAGQVIQIAEQHLDQLAARLQTALELEPGRNPSWRKSLTELLQATARGVWTAEAKLLYDLQKACVDHEREIYTLAPIGWIFSLGRRPLKRPLPNQRLVRLTRHLRSALSRIPRIQISDRSRMLLKSMIVDSTHHAEKQLRERLRPLIESSLDHAELRPSNVPEKISFNKITEEMLDQVVDSGFLTMGHVRDIVARGSIRQPDLGGAQDLKRGDRILRADRRLRVSLDGVYHRGEIYLRTIQRASFLAFGTKIGRWLTLYLVLPFGCAFGALVTVQEILHLLRVHVEWLHTWSVVLFGIFNFFLFHHTGFRDAVVAILHLSWRWVKFLFIQLPALTLQWPRLKNFLASRFFDWLRWVLIQPLIASLMTYVIVSFLDRDLTVRLTVSVSIYLTLLVLLLTPHGKKFEERAADLAVAAWGRFRIDFLPGLIRFFLDVFERFLQGVERILYTIDERLRFRAGQSRWNLATKAFLTVLWGGITYLVRIYINLLVEPQINPIKHFPTVTVAAKMIIPYLEILTKQIASALWFLGRVPALGIAGMTVFFLPGLAGFVVWELKENWRLFEANRSPTLRPVMIGHHGETMKRLLCPGFHSGTIPKLHAKHRRAIKKSYRTGDNRQVHKSIDRIHEAQDSVRLFVQREFIRLLNESSSFAENGLSCGEVRTSTNMIAFEVSQLQPFETKFGLSFSYENDRLIAAFALESKSKFLSATAASELNAAVTGFLALAGVETIRLLGGYSSPSETPLTPLSGGAYLLRNGPLQPVHWADWVHYWNDLSQSQPSRVEQACESVSHPGTMESQ